MKAPPQPSTQVAPTQASPPGNGDGRLRWSAEGSTDTGGLTPGQRRVLEAGPGAPLPGEAYRDGPWGEGSTSPSLGPPSVIQPKLDAPPKCENPQILRGTCQHNTERWLILPCKKRTCNVCGRARLCIAAARITWGVENLGGLQQSAYFVGTWEGLPSKSRAVRTLQKFIRWLRRDLNIPVQYASVWELQKRGALHVNLLLSPWTWVPWPTLFAAWHRFGGGTSSWIEYASPHDAGHMTKSNWRLATYMAKMEQLVLDGKAINYSRGWPKKQSPALNSRRGSISWQHIDILNDLYDLFEHHVAKGYWVELTPGEWGSALPEPCQCFERSPPCQNSPP